jgi:uncharacterized membrane protein YhaH (DUF805 family)
MSDKRKRVDTLKKEQYHALVGEVDMRKNAELSPMSYVGTWDFVVVFMAVFLRFLVSTNLKQYKIENEKGESFDYSKYLDSKHLIRWAIHLITALIGIIILPEIFILYVYKKYDIGLTDWALMGSFIIGFVGYDMIRIGEKIIVLILGKLVGYKPDDAK